MDQNTILNKLNNKQKEAVVYNDGPLAIIAGAGSGKTRTLTHKIAYLILSGQVEPSRILAVTFTNKAANEMKERVVKLVGKVGESVKIYTYHSLCARILREDITHFEGYTKKFNIIDNIDQNQILRPGYKKLALSPRGLSYASVIDYISKNKNKGIEPETLLKDSKTDTETALANLYKYYLEETLRSKSLDFDDLLIFVKRLFDENEEVTKKWARRFGYVLVDEFQDTSYVQYDIIKKLAPDNHITVVGDPDQTIYTWRFADPKLIMQFEKNFKNAKIIMLEQNYRSTNQILDAANKLISKNKNRYEKNLFTENGDGDIINFSHTFSEEAEARWIVSQIDKLKKNKTQLKDIAILYRSNYLSNTLEKALIESNINYILFGGIRFYQRQEIKDAISYLKIINNGDDVAFNRMINVPVRKIGPAALEKIKATQEKYGLTLFATVIKHFNELDITKAAKLELAKFIKLLRKYQLALKTNKVSLVLHKFLIEVGYYDIWSAYEDKGRLDNLKELVKSVKEWEEKNPEGTLDQYLDEISLYIDKENGNLKADYVSLMTIHTSKGLEFENVFVYGFSEGVFPSNRSLDEGGNDALEEERRLAYVAATRAMKRLFITSSRGYSIDHSTQKKPSRFVSELGINIKNFTREFIAPKDFSENYNQNMELIEGDKVMHEKFGEGVVVAIHDKLADIAFKAPHGVKTLMKNHKSLMKQ